MAIITAQNVYDELGLCPPNAQEVNIVASAMIRAHAAVARFIGYDPQMQDLIGRYRPQRDYTGRNTSNKTDIEGGDATYYSGKITQEWVTEGIPVRVVYGLWMQADAWSETKDGSFGDETELTEGVDFWPNYDVTLASGQKVCRCGIIRTEGYWCKRPGSIKISYRYGYTPDELKGTSTGGLNAVGIWESVLDEAARRAKKILMGQKKTGVGFVAGNLQSERLGDYSYSLGATSRSDEIRYGDIYDLMPISKERLADFRNWGYPLNP